MQLGMAAVAIRRSRPGDEPFVTGLALRVFGEYTKRPVVGPGVTLIAARDDRPVGFVTVRSSGPARFTVMAIAVEPDAQGTGAGRRLMQAAERYAKARRARVVDAYTAEANVAALSLFHKSGFRIVRRLRRFYPRGQNACLLEKEL